MPKKKPVQSALSPRQLRRKQQRQNAPVVSSVSVSTASLEPIVPDPSEALGPSVMVPVFSSIIIVGYLLFARGIATLGGNELSHHQSLFTAVNAATLTGFQQARNPDDYTPAGRLLTFGLMLTGILFSLICGGTAVSRIARLRFTGRQIVAWAFGSVLLVAIGGGLAIKLSGSDVTDRRTFIDDVFLAVSAFGNSGLTLGTLPAAASIGGMTVLLPLAILGGLGLPVLMELLDRRRGELSLHSRTVLNWTAGSYLVITLILFLLHWPGPNEGGAVWRSAFVDASQQAINARSAGFQFEFASRLPQATTFALILVMLVGASPGGSAGGVKVTTLAELSRGTRDVLNGRSPGRPFGIAIVWLVVYLGLLTVSTIALLITEPEIHLDRTLFLAASALGNVGLSHNPIDASTAGLYVLSATMMLGRIAPVMMLWYVVDTTPEAKVAVG